MTSDQRNKHTMRGYMGLLMIGLGARAGRPRSQMPYDWSRSEGGTPSFPDAIIPYNLSACTVYHSITGHISHVLYRFDVNLLHGLAIRSPTSLRRGRVAGPAAPAISFQRKSRGRMSKRKIDHSMWKVEAKLVVLMTQHSSEGENNANPTLRYHLT